MSAIENYFIRENKIFIPATKWFPERCIAEINENNKEYILQSLITRFSTLVEKVEEVKQKVESTPDIGKLTGFLTRTKSYIVTAIAIGDYESLLTRLDGFEQLMKDSGGNALQEKERICAEAKAVLDAGDTKESTAKMRELQRQFRELPGGYDERSQALRNTFESINDEFYKRKKEAYDVLEKELEVNLEKKVVLCEKAEALKDSSDWKITTDAYLELNEEWKKIGFVPKHRKEELWLRFSTAKDIFFSRKKEHIGEIKNEQEDNLVHKLELVEKAVLLKDSKDWKKTSDEFRLLMEEWKKIGRVPAEKSEEIWNAFLEPQNVFYRAKDEYYSNLKMMAEDNYAKKMAIVAHAEELQHSENFEISTKEFNDMFEEWKKIGRIPKEYGDEPWERFLAARRLFFERKDAYRELRKKEQSHVIEERLGRNKKYFSKLSRELRDEENLIEEMKDRIANLPNNLRSYEKREEYLESMEEIKANMEDLKHKVADLKEAIYQDEYELRQINRVHHKKEQPRPEDKQSTPENDLSAPDVQPVAE